MRTQVYTYELYTFEELDDDARQRAIDSNRDINTDYEWWDCTFYDVKSIGKILGIEIEVENIYFSGFSSQGDGAQFTGQYSYAKDSCKAIRAYAPLDTDLHKIADNLRDVQRKNFYSLFAVVQSAGRYSHPGCTRIDVEDMRGNRAWNGASDDAEECITEYLRDFMYWIYKTLEREHDYLTSDECIRDTLIANEYEFLANGDIS